MNKEEIYKKALHKWGPDRQFYILIEECSEVIKECTKILREEEKGTDRYTKLFEEIVDLEIMIEKIKLYYNVNGRYDNMMNKRKKDKLKLISTKLKNE